MFRKSKAFIAVLMVAAMLASTCSAATYTVKKGDTLWALSRKYDVTIQEIVDANPAIKDPNLIYVDQKLEIPEKKAAETPSASTPVAGETAANASSITGVKTIGFVDTDGAKVRAIEVEYNTDMTGANVSASTYEIDDYGLSQGDAKCEIGSNPGVITNVYAKGSSVIIEVNTDYQLGSVPTYQVAMYAGVKQVEDITLANGETVKASDVEVVNYTVVEKQGRNGVTYSNTAIDGTYTIDGVDAWQLFTKEDGTAFHATNCFEELDGTYVDVDLPYALFVPADYSADKEYALVLQVHDAGFMGDDPMITLTESQGNMNFASDEIQQIVKDAHGLDGIIVVAPQICNDLRSTRDNWSLSAAVPATWQLLDSITATYNISMDHIYGTGQSMGGMQVVAMAAQRDNYFAGIWANGCQWGSNYNLSDVEYSGVDTYAEAPVDGVYITGKDADGNEVDYRNWYYMVSDDNILITNCAGDQFSTQTWRELDFLYHDLAGTELIYENYKAIWNPLTASEEEQNAAAKAVMDAAAESDLGFVWTAFEGGNHMATWIYSHGVKAHYEWLLTQTQDTIKARGKLECLTNNFEYADEQLTTADRELAPYQSEDGEMVYYPTGKAGAGTADYNGCWLKMGKYTIMVPNWKPVTEPSITGVKAIGFVDTDGAKVRAIEVEYNTDMTGADVSADTYEIAVNSGKMSENMGTGEIGDITNVYAEGSKVVIEVYTDYLLSGEQTFTTSMCVGVTQVADITVGDTVIKASEEAVTNYVETESYNSWKDVWTTVKTAVTGTYTIEGIEGFKYYTNNTEYGTPDGPSYHVDNCFDEKSGEYNSHDVGYALYVPEDYDPNGSYAMVVIDNPAVDDENTHPLVSVLTTRSPALLASEYGQNLVKENWGLDGLIVVVPVVAARVDDNACTPSQYEALLALWDHIQDEYSIDENHVYGIGQSVGGMVLMETNRNRDNYFAGILMFENQWAQNYYKDTLFVRNQASDEKTASTAPMHYPRADADITWDFYYDTEGNKVYEDHDPYNLYYLISDDNIMVMNRSANNLSNNTWNELSCLYQDTVGVSIEQLIVSEGTVAEQEAQIEAYLTKGNEDGLGLYWVTFENGSNGYSARRVLSGYEWLLSQSRETAMAREKLDINKPFELADEQIQTEDRATAFTDQDGNTIYVKTAKAGSGTQFYNTSWLNLSAIADAEPGWLPEGMSWETGVEAADIVGVTALDGAVAIEYSVDMADLVINLKGDDIIGLDGNVREDIKIVLDPYKFYDANGNEIKCAITNVYVNDSAATVNGAKRGTGSGRYVIVEIDSNTAVSGIKQVTTVRTSTAISTAIDKLYQ